jgi:hypothetical protein
MPQSLNIEIDLGDNNVLDELHRINKEMYAMVSGGRDLTHEVDIAGQHIAAFGGKTGLASNQITQMRNIAKNTGMVDSMKNKSITPELAKTQLKAPSIAAAKIQIDNAGLGKIKMTNEQLRQTGSESANVSKNIGVAGSQMEHFARLTGVSNTEMTRLILTARKDMRVDRELQAAAKAAGLTEHELKLVNQQLKQVDPNAEKAGGKLGKMGTIMKGAAAYFGISVLKGFNDRIIEESNRTENALIGFKTVVKNSLGTGMVDAAIGAAQQLKQSLGGAMDEASIQASLKNLLNSGFSLDQSIGMIEKNVYMASVNRQSQYANIADAVVTYTEGIKNNNAMLTDSTGISENLSVTLKRQGLSMDMLNNAATKGAVIQAIYNAHTKEGAQYQSAFNQQMAGYQGLVAKDAVGTKTLLTNLGNLFKIGWMPILSLKSRILDFFNDSERGVSRLKTALIYLGAVAIVSLIGYTYKWMVVNGQAALSTIIAWAPVIVTVAAIAAGLTALYLIIDDIYGWVSGKDSLIGTWLGDFNTIWPRMKAWFGNAGKWMVDTAKKYGKYLIMYLFPISMLYFFKDEILGFFVKIGDAIGDFFSGLWSRITKGLKGMLADIPLIKTFISTSFKGAPAGSIEARANGGDVEPNRPYLIGEKGPEIKTFKTGGTIIPNHKLGGSGGKTVNMPITINIDARGASAADARSIGEAAKKAILSAFPAIRAQLGLEVNPA